MPEAVLRCPVLDRLDLVAAPVAAALVTWAAAVAVEVAEIDGSSADTAAFCARYGVPTNQSANCVVVAGRRGAEVRYAACLVLATTRADVNGVVRRRLDARKASFAAMEDAVALSGMEFGGITPIGLPVEWPVFVDAAVVAAGEVVIGSGLRGSKLWLPGELLTTLSSAVVLEGLAS
jgi:prolyl-tRNA editing enzyme YbaK/EbsC (Cys-tRNA(Pro) deacylase)